LNDPTFKDQMIEAFQTFYHQYVVETANGSFQVFQSFTYGEMTISFLLATILLFSVFKFIFEVFR
jgi:hypothetical protein